MSLCLICVALPRGLGLTSRLGPTFAPVRPSLAGS